MNTILFGLIGRELRLALRHGADTLAVLLFFLLCGSLFPLALGPSQELLRRMAPGIVWVCALLATLLPLDRLFGNELEDGSLDQLLLLGVPPSLVAGAKITAHWLTTGLPLLLAASPMAIMLGMKPADLAPLLIGLLLGTPTLSLLGGMAAATVLGARRGGVLLPLLVLPLATPVLIFGAAAAYAGQFGQSDLVELDLLGAFLALSALLCPLAAGTGLRAAAAS
ncbi:heme exporter protein CcmB [Acidomonas methanolica]|uniref:Heme exporter protein B n=1 Tax=Acidomonas methanolica NBRC 104435 TaxID=1231351 RepID=A0A023D0M8_ACIMT|nr:heme exporter protein CcmB [Acidomonas methanolica]MBU2653357.1 heme exporter protein CcmB [Acidomonas methanolica]TCS32308.1 heme exporter protein B [Acidomonas methanolica]GAJ27683.1 heme exporter protein B [Acidomonas methanolica NBRC 104435]GBQ48040.1 heme exporter protein B [Acidomonas methanolica]GEK97745.1 heme exporter protein B [Acidomonas methanolica NBRC 104435]